MKALLLGVLPTLAPMIDYSTAQIAARISSSANQQKTCRLLLDLARRCPGLTELGPERPGKGAMTGKTVRPRLWHYMPREAVEAALATGGDTRLDRLETEVEALRVRVEALEGKQ